MSVTPRYAAPSSSRGFNRCVWNTVWILAITCPDNDLRWINSLLPVPWLHCDIYLHSRTSSHRDSRDRYGDRVCLGTSGRCDDAFVFWTFLCQLGQITTVSDDRPCSHRCRNCGPLLWSINSWKAASRGIVRCCQRTSEWLTSNPGVAPPYWSR